MTHQTVAIIQARMTSSRLPGKVLRDIGGEPMLARVVERTRRAQTLDEVVVATTTDASDDPLAEMCAQRGYPYTRGSLHDVLDRYYQAAKHWQADTIVRLTADCPLMDPDLIDATVRAFRDEPLDPARYRTVQSGAPVSFAANRLAPPWGRTYPIGLDVEVCNFDVLERAWKEATLPYQREHVMPYLYEEAMALPPPQPGEQWAGPQEPCFHILLLNHPEDYGSLRWTVDALEDLALLQAIYARFPGRDDFSWRDVLEVYLSDPVLQAINAGIKHKDYRQHDERMG